MGKKLVRNGLFISILIMTSILFVPTAVQKNTSISSSPAQRPTLGDTLNMSEGGRDSINSTKDSISISKTVSWTSYNGKATDSNGNPYVKVDFQVNETPITTTVEGTKQITETIQVKKKADIVLALDKSESMNDANKLDTMKKTAADFVEKILSHNNVEVRVGVVAFSEYRYLVHTLS